MNHPKEDNRIYKGFLIRPLSKKLANGKWDLDLAIEKYKEGQMIEKHYASADQYDTYEESLNACLSFGARIIDNKVDGLTAPM
jgi:hypothetical protein